VSVLLEQRPALGQEEIDAVASVLESGWLGMGGIARTFEEELSRRLGSSHVLGCHTGTAALHLALAALDIGPGDEVVVPSMTHVASVQAILAVGARPVFCEVSPATLTIDVDDALARVTSRTRAIMPVHYGGAVCDMESLVPQAHASGLVVVEDVAQAFGSTCEGKSAGTFGDAGCFSFDPVKNVTCGEGGAVVTEDDDLAARIVSLRVLGIDRDSWTRYNSEKPWSYSVTGPGFRYSLSDINAAIGLVQLEKLETFRARKVAIVRRYLEALADIPEVAPIERDLGEVFPFLHTVRVLDGRRDALVSHLFDAGIHAWVRPLPNHVQPAFRARTTSLPVSEELAREVMTLPLHVGLSDGDVERVIAAVRAFFSAPAS
jgi:perosamine synthetase